MQTVPEILVSMVVLGVLFLATYVLIGVWQRLRWRTGPVQTRTGLRDLPLVPGESAVAGYRAERAVRFIWHFVMWDWLHAALAKELFIAVTNRRVLVYELGKLGGHAHQEVDLPRGELHEVLARVRGWRRRKSGNLFIWRKTRNRVIRRKSRGKHWHKVLRARLKRNEAQAIRLALMTLPANGGAGAAPAASDSLTL